MLQLVLKQWWEFFQMSDYGLVTFDELGQPILDTQGRYPRLVYTTTVSSSGSVTLPGLEGRLSAQWMDQSAAPLSLYIETSIVRSGNTVTWTISLAGYNHILYIFIYT